MNMWIPWPNSSTSSTFFCSLWTCCCRVSNTCRTTTLFQCRNAVANRLITTYKLIQVASVFCSLNDLYLSSFSLCTSPCVDPHQFAFLRLCFQVGHFPTFPQYIRDHRSHVRLHFCYIATRSRRPAPVHARTWQKVMNLPLIVDSDSELWNLRRALLLSDCPRLHPSFLCVKILNSARLSSFFLLV